MKSRTPTIKELLLQTLSIGVVAGVINVTGFVAAFPHLISNSAVLAKWSAQMIVWYGVGILAVALVAILTGAIASRVFDRWTAETTNSWVIDSIFSPVCGQ